MENRELAEYVDQQRWLLNNGFISDDVKNQLFFCGSIVHKEVKAVELDLVPEEKLVKYRLYFNKRLIAKVNRYHKLSKSKSLLSMWMFRRLLRKEGSLDFANILNKFVRDYCGPKWKAEVTLQDFDTYVEGLGEQSENPGTGQQPN